MCFASLMPKSHEHTGNLLGFFRSVKVNNFGVLPPHNALKVHSKGAISKIMFECLLNLYLDEVLFLV